MTFQPFAVQCLTCGSRLRVTDPSLLGTIVSCPKCHSMVQVDASLPAQATSEGDSPAEGPTKRTKSPATPPPIDGLPDDQAGDAQKTGPPPQQPVAVGHSDVDSQAITAEAMAESEAADIEASGERGFADSEDYQRTDDELPPADAWQSDQTRRRRQLALIASVAVLGVLASLLFFGWFVHRWQQDAAVAAKSEEAISSEEADKDPASLADPSDDPANSGSVPPSSEDETANEPTEDTGSADDEASIDNPLDKETTEDSGGDAADTTNGPIPSGLLSGSPLDDPSDSANPDDPDSATSDADSREPATREPAGDGNGDEDTGMEELPPGLAQYTEFLLDDGAAEETNLEAPPTREEIELEAAAEIDDGPLDAETPEPLNLKAAFNTRIAVASKGYPLADLTLLAGQLADMPIQIDWVSFDLAEIDIDRDVPMPKGWQTLGELLKQAAGTVGAELREEAHLVVLTLSDQTFAKTWDKVTETSDFADADSTIATVNRFLGAAPNAKQLTVEENREEKQLALLAFEALRRMRGVEPKVADEHFLHWAGLIGAEPAERSLPPWPTLAGGDSGPQYDTPVTLAEWLREISRRNAATAVVNWHDAIKRGAHPALLLIPHNKEDAGRMLNDELSRFGLQVRKVDQGGWWIGAESTYDRLTAMVWTPPLGDRRDEFFDRVSRIMKDTPPDAFRMAYDESSDRGLLLLPRFILRQLPEIAPLIAVKQR